MSAHASLPSCGLILSILNSDGTTLCSRPYVLPNKYVLKLTDADLGAKNPKGIVALHLLEATNVCAMSSAGNAEGC